MKHWITSLRIAATLVGTIVGAGFATGKEIIQFFSSYGAWGTLGILIVGLLFMFISTKMMVLSHDIQAHSFKEFNHYLFGSRLGTFLSILTVWMMIGVTAVMLSGAGALFHEQLGWSPLFGIFLTMGLCYLFLQRGIQGVFAVNSLVVPLMVTVILIISVIRFPTLHLHDWFPHFHLVIPPMQFLVSAIYYVSFNIVTTQAVLVPLGQEISDRRSLIKGGILGGLLFTLCLMAAHLALTSLPSNQSYDIPMAALASNMGTILYFSIFVLIFGEILTTYVGNLYGMTRHFSQTLGLSPFQITLGLLLITFAISLFDYGRLIESLYPFFGQLGLLFTFILFFKKKADKPF
ncbi:MAG TPA: GerAB/ArcD/ProY family transporter [Sporolactobacillaceae bacterium]|nr:GerAB/ArcD/ProY family transporter [Sporolactobacillaceae bacterium]